MSATFTIEYTPVDVSLFLYPSGSSSTDFTAVGATENYECVDEAYSVPDDDTTYVWWNAISVGTDIYTMQDHGSVSGTIQSITIYARAKSQTYSVDSTATYDIILDDGFGNLSRSSEATYGSDFILGTSYNLFYCNWISHPTTGATLTWTDIDNFKIGFECSSPTVNTVINDIFRPNAEGDWIEWTPIGDTLNHDCVDEEIHDGNTTHVRASDSKNNPKNDRYAFGDADGVLQNDSVSTINSITLYWTAKREGSGTLAVRVYPKLTSDATFTGSYSGHNHGANYTSHSHAWNSHPTTSAAWTWADWDDMELGYQSWADESGARVHVTQMYVNVNHTVNTNPEVRTTQVFAKVIYQPDTSTYYLNKPESYTYRNSREIKKLNTWAGNRIVYDVRRRNKTLSMTGGEWDTATSTATTRLDDFKDMNGTAMVFSDLGDSILNNRWMLKSFDYEKDSTNPNLYVYHMELEKE